MSEKKKILTVDDSRTALMMTAMALRATPYALTTATDGEEAVAKAVADPPDLIVLDVVMPKVDGFEACRRLRSHPATRHIPILMLTTRGESENAKTGIDCGCNEYLTKPLNFNEFVAKVKSYLGD